MGQGGQLLILQGGQALKNDSQWEGTQDSGVSMETTPSLSHQLVISTCNERFYQ